VLARTNDGAGRGWRRIRLRTGSFDAGPAQIADYLALDPSGKGPLLITPQGPLAENVAIARYLAQTFDGLLPKAQPPYEDTRITSNLSSCTATLHAIVTRTRR
jgi:glutathione S-transferase